MTWFSNLGTSLRLLLSFSVILLLLGFTATIGYRGMEHVHDQGQIAINIGEVDGRLNESRALLMTLLYGQRQDGAALRDEIAANTARNEELLARLDQLTSGTPSLHESVRQLALVRAEHRRVREQQVLGPLAEGRIEAAREAALGPQVETYGRMRKLLDAIGAQAQQAATRAWQEAARMMIVGATAAVAAVALIVMLLTRVTAGPLRDLAAAADRIVQGDLDVALPSLGRRDEIGALSDSFVRMTGSLRGMAEVARRIAEQDLTVDVQPQSPRDQLGNAFATMVSRLRSVTGTLASSVSALAASASEILAATTQVASGAAETGTAIAQTTTTVEEVKQTAQLATQKARLVADGAQRAIAVGQGGRQAVDATVEGMRHIQGQMETIAETVVRLSEQSQAIGEIIAVVNDLAEQSNLLAVNAAIEAAKAGEHGRGFTVVAQEVRSLAEQSRQATAQVRTILHDIQKATTAAVLATEQGSKAVETGVRQSTEAGDAIAQLTGTIGEAAQAATQIAASSQQQLVGTDQVALAMQNIRDASMQNVAATRQAETAAHGLNQIGGTLKDLVAQYRL